MKANPSIRHTGKCAQWATPLGNESDLRKREKSRPDAPSAESDHHGCVGEAKLQAQRTDGGLGAGDARGWSWAGREPVQGDAGKLPGAMATHPHTATQQQGGDFVTVQTGQSASHPRGGVAAARPGSVGRPVAPGHSSTQHIPLLCAAGNRPGITPRLGHSRGPCPCTGPRAPPEDVQRRAGKTLRRVWEAAVPPNLQR